MAEPGATEADFGTALPMDGDAYYQALGPNPVLGWLVAKGPGVTALLVILLGPVVMWTTHFIYLRTGLLVGVVRPLTYFLSATWGDALLLPVIAYLSVSALRDIADYGSQGRLRGWLAWIPLLWAVFGTAALNVVWLSDRANANWTQPVGASLFGGQLTLNTAGWLHAAFFVAMQWLVAEFALRLVITLVHAHAHQLTGEADARLLGRMMLKVNVMLFLALTFSALLVRDYWPQVTATEPGQIWTWFLIPMLVLVLCVAANSILLEVIAREVREGRGVAMRGAQTSLDIIVSGWSVLLIAASLYVIGSRLQSVLLAVGLLVGSCIALAGLAATNVWAEVYLMQRRPLKGHVAVAALAAVTTITLAGFVLGLDMIVVHGPIGSLSELVGPWLGALAVALLSCAVAAAIGLALEGYESLSPESLKRHCYDSGLTYLGAEPPQHDIIQNLMQFGALQGLLPLYAAAYVLLAEPLMLGRLDAGTQVSLLFGYAGVVAAAVTFPLYNNMQYIRDLEHHKGELVGETADAKSEELAYLAADKTFTMRLSVAVGVVAVLCAMWMWITVLDLVLAAA